MKRLIFITLSLVLLGGLSPLRAQNLAQMALEQVEQKIKLPEIVNLFDTSVIRRYNLDKVIMQLPVKRNGRIAAYAVKFINSSITPVNNIFLEAVEAVRLPRELVVPGDTLTIGFQVAFEFLYNEKRRFTTRYSVMREGGPRNLPKENFYQNEMGKIPGRDGSYSQKRFDADQVLLYNKYKVNSQGVGEEGMPKYRVTLVKSK